MYSLRSGYVLIPRTPPLITRLEARKQGLALSDIAYSLKVENFRRFILTIYVILKLLRNENHRLRSAIPDKNISKVDFNSIPIFLSKNVSVESHIKHTLKRARKTKSQQKVIGEVN